MKKWFIFLLLISLTACVYRLDIQQGNIIGQKDVDRLRVGLTKNQVIYVLGNPVVKDSFNDQNWHYHYTYKYGKSGEVNTKRLDLVFQEDALISASGDFEIPPKLLLVQLDQIDQADPETAPQPH